MKILIIGDSHGNIANLKHVMGFAKNIGACAVIHTGDWNNLKSLETVLEYKIPLYSCLGNADIDQLIADRLQSTAEQFNLGFLRFELDGLKFGVVHNFTVDSRQLAVDCDVVFTGHYHSQKEWEQNNIKIIRPGALENDINFAVFDTVSKGVELIKI